MDIRAAPYRITAMKVEEKVGNPVLTIEIFATL